MFYLLNESLKVEGVTACIHCSHNVGVGKSFETLTVIKKAEQINLTCKCVCLAAVRREVLMDRVEKCYVF